MQEEIKKQVLEAMRAKDTMRRDVLKVALGDIQMGGVRKGEDLTDDEAAAVVRKIIKANDESLDVTKDDATKEKLTFENDVLKALLPQTLDVDAIIAALAPVADAVKATPNDGAATGVAMKHLKSTGAAVEGKDVAMAVKQLRA